MKLHFKLTLLYGASTLKWIQLSFQRVLIKENTHPFLRRNHSHFDRNDKIIFGQSILV